MGFTIRDAGIGDLDQLVAIRMSAMRHVYAPYGNFLTDELWAKLEKEVRDFYFDCLLGGSHVACLALVDDEVVGCGGMCIYRELPSPENSSGISCYIMNVYTAPEHRHQGIGRAMMDTLISKAHEAGARKVYLETSDAARKLYADEGFVDMKGYMRLPGDYMEWRRKLGIERCFFYATSNGRTMDFKPSVFMAKVRSTKPLVHHITNYVTVNDCANICLCAGGSPVMTDEIKDVSEMVRLASCVVINIGTLNDRTVESMMLAASLAHEKGIPVVLDPVGVGATKYRTEVALRLLETGCISVVKGNMGEMGVLSGAGGTVRGVDSEGSSADPARIVRDIAGKWNVVAAASGEVDYVSDGEKVYRLSNGNGYMGTVSGTGCMLSSVVGCYVGACGPSLEAVASAVTAMNVACEYALGNFDGPGTFKPALLDALYCLDGEIMDAKAKVELLRSQHLELAGDTVDLRLGGWAYANAGLAPGLNLRPPGIGYERDVEAAARCQLQVLMELLQGIHLEDDLPLAALVPGVEGLPVALLREQGALHGRVADLGRYLAGAHLEVLPHDDDELVLLSDRSLESESHASCTPVRDIILSGHGQAVVPRVPLAVVGVHAAYQVEAEAVPHESQRGAHQGIGRHIPAAAA